MTGFSTSSMNSKIAQGEKDFKSGSSQPLTPCFEPPLSVTPLTPQKGGL